MTPIAICKACGRPTRFLRDDGGTITVDCRCEQTQKVTKAIAKTIDPEFVGPDGKLIMMDSWNPPLFARPCSFPELIRAQRALLVSKLDEFAFRPDEEGVLALTRSVKGKANLFLRGTQGVGRGLVAANLKVMAAIGGFSVTPRTEECAWSRFEVFKDVANKAASLGSVGTEASSGLYWHYEMVDVMVVEGVRAETRLDLRGDSVRHKSLGAPSIDRLMAQRANRKQGSMIVTSHDFLGQIRETLGDYFLDEMTSPRTTIVVLFSPQEADVLHEHLVKTYNEHKGAVSRMRNREAPSDKRRLTDRAASAEDGALMRGALLFGSAMGNWCPPGPTIMDMTRQLVENEEIGNEPTGQFRKFVEEEESGGRMFDDERRGALVRAVSACPFLRDGVAEREALEVVRMIRMAITPGRLAAAEEQAKEMVKRKA